MSYFRNIESIDKLIETILKPDRKFTRHYIVTWSIHGLMDVTSSPIFQSLDVKLDAEIGSCCLIVTPDCAEDLIKVQLMMDVIENSYFLSYRFGFQTESGRYWHDDHIINFTESITLSETYETISNYFNPETESLEILCQMMITTLVSVPEENVALAPKRPEIAICLDFYTILETRYLCDIVLQVDKEKIAAHKAILTSKSTVFQKMVEEMDSSQEVLVLSEKDCDIVSSMLIFMYTGNFEILLIFCTPTIAFYECVVKYDVTDLRTFLLPVEIKLTDVCLIKLSEFTWHLKSGLLERSPLLRTEFGSFYLKLVTENNNEDSVTILIEPSNILVDVTMILKIQMFDRENKVFIAKSVKCSFKKGSEQEVGLTTVMKYNLIPHFLESVMPPDDVLLMSGLVKISNYGILIRHSSRKNETNLRDKFANFECLLDKNKYSDFTLFTGDNKFKVHKAVLGGRTSFFEKLFANHPTKNDMHEKDVKQSAMEKFIVYLYSGKVGQDLESLLDLLFAFDKYLVITLAADVIRLLQHELTPENVCTILLTIHKLKSHTILEKIKNSSFSMLCSNFSDIEPSQGWENLLTESEELAKKILLYLQEVYMTA